MVERRLNRARASWRDSRAGRPCHFKLNLRGPSGDLRLGRLRSTISLSTQVITFTVRDLVITIYVESLMINQERIKNLLWNLCKLTATRAKNARLLNALKVLRGNGRDGRD